MHEKTLKSTGNFPLALIGQVYLETNKIFLHNTYSGILYKVISIFGHNLNVLLLSCFPAAHSSEEKEKNFAAFPLACKQALCLGKG